MRTFEFLVRMVFSALADADFLDTERFMGSRASAGDSKSDLRPQFHVLARYREALDTHLACFASAEPTPVNRERSRVLSWCREAAERHVGAYSLTVPTGGGKTLSALAFALRHAEVHGLERVVVALPFLSILDQTADVFRRALEPQLGTPVLVEHHSSVMPTVDTVANRLAAENWDAPLIVTTQVQLFESLFSRRPSQCRKLHRLAKSVVVLDEVQTLPVELLAPILGQLQELRAHYDTTLVLTTATQPSLHTRELGPKLFQGLRPAPVEIVPEHEIEGLFETLRRVDIELPEDDAPIGLEALADRVQRHAQVLVVVHRRADAIRLFQACEYRNERGWIHLSALMCPAHRREVLAEIRSRLAAGLACRVVSTQLVEAGVDVDFPVVYRAMAGLESLAQAAGRCNREGRLEGRGRFIVFRADSEPPGSLRHHRDIAAAILKADPSIDPLAPATFRRYFDALYAQRSLDSRGIQALRAELRFESVDREFQMIESGGETVFVPYGDKGRRAVEAVRFAGPSRERFRGLQAYGVTVYPFDLAKLRAAGAIEELDESKVNVLVSDIHYDRSVGLVVDPGPFGAAII